MKSSFYKRKYSWLFHVILIMGIPLSFMIGGLGAVIVVAIVGFAVFPKAFAQSKNEGAQERLKKSYELTNQIDRDFDQPPDAVAHGNAHSVHTITGLNSNEQVPPEERIDALDLANQIEETLSAVKKKRGKSSRNALYLRPFDSTNKFEYEQSIPSSGSLAGDLVNPSYWGREKSKDLERMYAEGLEEIAPLVAMGRPGEHEGALRVKSEDVDTVWKRKVTKLMIDCCPVFVIPSANEGTVWEMLQAQKLGILPKTIFVMPGEDSLGGKKFDDFWDEVKVLLKSKAEIELPEYYGSGAWFRYHDDWTLKDIIHSNAMSWASAGYDEAQSIKFAREGMRDQIRDVFSSESDEEDYFLEGKRGRKVATSLKGWSQYVSDSRMADEKYEKRENIKGVIALVVVAGLILAYCTQQ